MTQVAPVMHRAPVAATPRKPLTRTQRREILARQEDRCGECHVSLIWQIVEDRKVYGPMIDEHVLRLFVGGSNDLKNRELWCAPCSKAKTTAEAPQNAKVRRILAWEENDAEPSRLRGPVFPKHLTKGLDGKVRPRKQRTTDQQAASAAANKDFNPCPLPQGSDR